MTTVALAAVVAAGLPAVPAAADPPRERATITAPAEAPTAGTVDLSFGPGERAQAVRTAQREVGHTARVLGLSPKERLRATDVVRDADGATHVRYDRTYAGLPVVGGDLVVHKSPGGLVTDTDFASDADLSELSSLRARVPLTAAASSARRAADLVRVHAQERPAMAVYAVGRAPRLVWETVVTGRAEDGPQRDVVYTDARSGRLVNSWSMTHGADGPGHSLYSGTVRVKTTRPAARFRLRDQTRGGQRTHDAHNRAIGLHNDGSVFTDADNRWGNGHGSSRQSAAVDAHYGAAKTWDYFRSRFGRRGVRNDGVGVLSRVHYGRPGTPAAGNAFWDDRCFCMTFGGGDRFARPLVSVDIVAHEMTHGITSHTAGLLYFGETGGLNEATSDIFGTMVEFSASRRADRGDYLIGEKVLKVRPGYLRRMDRPGADGASHNCWTPTMGRDDVHYTSGPANHFFYLLAEGTRAKTIGGRRHSSPTCNDNSFGGIGKARAARIWYRALNVYMTSTTDYADARDATVRAARDIYGRDSGRCRAVARAWEAVRVRVQNENCHGAVALPGGPNLVRNGGFEDGNRVWETRTAGWPVIDRHGLAHAGQWSAVLNGYGTRSVESLSQDGITAPDRRRVGLRFQLAVFTGEPRSAGARDILRVRVRDADGDWRTVATYSNLHGNDTYTQGDVDLSAYRGQQITLRFAGRENAKRPTAFFIDDVQVRAR
ncbi:MAG TPA: M4 family metallopeptidase [Nocardioidaceae bacterium]|nr:M4 family metallopeptidase [Nocardioidaceae bacterium]